jgi:hypothetical protein
MAADGPLTIDELSAAVADALVIDYPGPPSGRVREVPDRRTIRWYTTIGLLDRPAAMRGRTALYGRRHLLQLVAIKRLQANGYSLADVQEELYGATDTTLTRLARLPESADEPATPVSDGRLSAVPGGPEMSSPRRPFPIEPESPTPTSLPGGPLRALLPHFDNPLPGRFWAAVAPPADNRRPADDPLLADNSRLVADPLPADDPSPAAVAPPAADPPSTLSTAIRLDGVTLVLSPGTHPPALDDLAAIQEAAAPLLAVLRQRGLDGTEGNAR